MKSFTILCLLFILACQPQVPSVALTEADKTAVMEASASYGNSIINGDHEKIRSLCAADIVLMPPQTKAASGVDAAMEVMSGMPAMEGNITGQTTEGSGNTAYVRGAFDLTFMVNDTLQVSDAGKFIEIWEKQDDGSWKLKVDIWNSDVTPAM